jgi:predicted PurR-regulated permease PerM
VYIHAVYFTVTTMTTVGYGDMSASTKIEHLFCIVLMVLGVIVFTFISGALSSVLSNFDATNAQEQEQ